ncbi:hypothetical protein KIW84_073887 [Lathyrus oleraceus]|uniref:Chromo domain-containing protein n=1 Tax=Pisum sativum TaxID=3888 RepID=A0A9D4VS80_PEA|nr:hypothetical protein KIW84_073887 [Pisum sativum]
MSLRLCESSSEEEEGVKESLEEREMIAELKTLQLSLQSREGFTSNKSFKVWVTVNERKVLTLIDSGATSNFIDSKLVTELKLKVVDTPVYVIEVGNGERLGGSDMVLGMDWLASLGNIEANFGELCLKWKQGRQKYNIQGDPALCTRQASWKAMLKALTDEGMGFYLHSMEAKQAGNNTKTPEWERILELFEEVFNLPSGLPPPREHDHAILLKHDAAIPNLRPYRIAWPLTQLLKKDSFVWSGEAQEAFEKLKEAMTTIPVLAMPDFRREFILETDASGKGIGAVLMQEGRPISYMSQTLSDRAQKKSVYERELMAIVIAIQKWRPYLLGRHFKVHTDQRSLKFITEQKTMGEEQQKWISKSLGFDFEVKYKPGKENNAADSLSRQMQYVHITTVQCEAWEGLEEEVQGDEKLKAIVQALLADPSSQTDFQLKGGRLCHEGRIVVPKQSPRIAWFLHEFHDTAVGGHSGYLRTYKKIASVVYWEEYWYNTNYHASLKTTPFEALYGRTPPVLIRGDTPFSAVDEVHKLTVERNVMLKELQEQLLKAQDLMRNQANKHRREVEHEVGDMVFLKIQPYKLKKLAKRLNQKLSPRFYGPYEVIQKIGAVAYKLKLPEDTRVHPVFHVSLLKKAVKLNVEPQPLPACMKEDWHLEPTPERVVETRRTEQGVLEVLIKWKNLPEFENSWELVEKMTQEFPEFLLEVKESFERGGIDRYGKVYSRTRKKREMRNSVTPTQN